MNGGIVTALVALLTFGLINFFKAKGSEGLLKNTETKEKDLELKKQENVIEAKVGAEEEHRKAIQEQFEKDTKDGVSKEQLQDFFGRLLDKSNDGTKH
jgi:hypothetical protein